MSFNGSGVFVRLYSWINDAAASIAIRADRMDNEMDGFATGLSNCITKDGQTTVTANLPMAGYKHTNVANASSNNEYAALGQVNTLISTATGSITLNSLSDVVITSAASGDHIYYNGTNWINVVKTAVPIDGIQTTGASGVILKNSAGTTVLTVGAGAATASTFAGNTTVQGLLAINGITYATGSIEIGGTASSPAFIKLAEDTDNGTNKATIIAPASIASDYTLTLPSAAGTIALTSDIPSSSLSTTVTLATGSPTTQDINIPANTRQFTLNLSGMSFNASAQPNMLLGTSGSFETTGYVSTATFASTAVGSASSSASVIFATTTATASDAFSGSITFTLVDSSTNEWAYSGVISASTIPSSFLVSGSKALSSALTRIRLTSVAGTATFDAGKANVFSVL
jgi:hypothetical protein